MTAATAPARHALRCALLAATVLALSACAARREPAPVVFRNAQPARTATLAPLPAVAAPTPSVTAAPLGGAGSPLDQDTRGVVDYGGYSAVVARPGDTVEAMAARVGIPAAALASYNGLPAGHAPRPGDELILPPDAVAAAPVAVPAAVPDAAASLPGAATPPVPAPSPGFDIARIEAAIGDAPAPAPAAPAAPRPEPTAAPVEAPAAPLPVEPQPQVAALPGGAAAPAPVAAAPAPSAPASVAPPVAPPPAASAAPRLAQPVQGSVTRSFSREPGARSDGMAYAAPAGEPVRAAADGQVALVSEALGGDLGTVVLIRHQDQLLTVYGRVDAVTVASGDRVAKGDVIGAVAAGQAGAAPSLHFEVRRGADPVDPAEYF